MRNNSTSIKLSIGLLTIAICIFITTEKSKALLGIPFTPKLYVSAGALVGGGGLTGAKVSNTVENLAIKASDSTSSDTGILFSVGLEPNLPIPVIGSLRPEIQYMHNFNKQLKGDAIGAGLYYDLFKMIPFLHPYVGVSVAYLSADAKLKLNATNIAENNGSVNFDVKTNKLSQTLVGFSVGANVSVPVIPLTFFAEYRFVTSDLLGPKVKTSSDNNTTLGLNINNAHYKSQGVLIGLRYYIL